MDVLRGERNTSKGRIEYVGGLSWGWNRQVHHCFAVLSLRVVRVTGTGNETNGVFKCPWGEKRI